MESNYLGGKVLKKIVLALILIVVSVTLVKYKCKKVKVNKILGFVNEVEPQKV